MSFGEAFASTYLAADRNQQAKAQQIYEQVMAQRRAEIEQQMMELRQREFDAEQDPNSFSNQLKRDQLEFNKIYRQGLADDREARANATAFGKFDDALKNGATYGVAINALRPDARPGIINAGVAGGNQKNMAAAIAQTQASDEDFARKNPMHPGDYRYLPPEPGAPPTMNLAASANLGPPPLAIDPLQLQLMAMLGGGVGSAALPPPSPEAAFMGLGGGIGAALPPPMPQPDSTPPGLRPIIEPGMAGPRMREPTASMAQPYTQEEFLSSQSPGYEDKKAQMEAEAKRKAAMVIVAQNRVKQAEERQAWKEKIDSAKQEWNDTLNGIKANNWRLKGKTMEAMLANLPDKLEESLTLIKARSQHLKTMDQQAVLNTGIRQGSLNQRVREFDARVSRDAQATRDSVLAAKEKARENMRKMQVQMSRLLQDKADIENSPDYQTNPYLHEKVKGVQDEALVLQQNYKEYQQVFTAADKMATSMQQDLDASGILRGANLTSQKKPVSAPRMPSMPQPGAQPQPTLQSLMSKYGVK